MDIATIATLTFTALQPFLAKGLEKIVEKSAEEGFNERKAIWEKVKGLFGYDDLTMLNLLKDAETSEKAKGKLEGKLETHLEAKPDIAKELEELINKLPKETTQKQNSITQTGNSNIANQDVSNSTIKINQK